MDSDSDESRTERSLPAPLGKHMLETRYWSDFNRVFYIPRSLQQVPDLPEWEANKGNWGLGKDVCERYDMVSYISITVCAPFDSLLENRIIP